MTGDEVRQVFEAMRPPVDIDRLCEACGVIERQRPLGTWVRALVISAGTPGGADQADLVRSALACGVPHVARSACSRWCDAPWERGRGALAAQALASARAPPVDRAGPLGGVPDGDLVEATTVTGRDALRAACPGTGGDAAMKVQTIRSVGGGAPVPYQCRPARAPDRRQVQSAASWRGDGLWADLASARVARRRAGDTHGVRSVSRRHENWPPNVDPIARGQVTQACLPGTDGAAVWEEETLVLEGRASDAEGQVGRGPHALPRRLVGVQPPPGSGLFLTNLPPRTGPRQVADRYRVGWEVARRLRLDQSGNRREAMAAEPPCTLTTRWHASLLAATIAALLAQTPHGPTRPQQAGAPRTQAPWPPRRLALPLAVSWQSLAQAVERTGTDATRRWDQIAAWLTHSGNDPHGRRRPSVLDHLRGWKRQPLARKQANSRDGSPRNIKKAA